MPLVKRIVDQAVGPTFGVVHAEHILYVPARSKRPTDEVVEPSNDQLADLAYRYPKEPSGVGKLTFLELAKKRKVTPFEPAPEEAPRRDEAQLGEMAAGFIEVFPKLKDKDALDLIDRTANLDVLKALFQAELDTDQPRDKIVKAFKAKGLKIVKEPEPLLEDDGEPGQGEA